MFHSGLHRGIQRLLQMVHRQERMGLELVGLDVERIGFLVWWCLCLLGRWVGRKQWELVVLVRKLRMRSRIGYDSLW